MGIRDNADVEKTSTSSGSGEYTDTWEPAGEGSEIVGVVADIREYDGPGGAGEPMPALVVVEECNEDGSGISHLSVGDEQELPGYQSRMQEFCKSVDIGDLLIVEYVGEKKTSSGFHMNTYSSAEIPPEQWEEMDEAEDIRELLEGSELYAGSARVSSSDGNSLSDAAKDMAGGVTAVDEPDESGVDGEITEEVIGEVDSVVEMHQGSAPLQMIETHLNDTRGYGVDVEAAVDEAGYTVEDGTVS